ncbi:type II toxin-antitoxin system VapC family toxin [Halovivax cerinus]|uniref:Type II toxin-antitoxin system VapC family toxin n=1 Tax=Halovivax cerinus TaxID=1487865 RepID=A0ABD5NT03_9EURY
MQWVLAPVLAEAYYGAATERSTVTVDELRNHLLGYPRVDADEEIARIAGTLLAEADDENGGRCGVSWNDALIGATAESLDESVLTGTVVDFEALGVSVETY